MGDLLCGCFVEVLNFFREIFVNWNLGILDSIWKLEKYRDLVRRNKELLKLLYAILIFNTL